MLVDITPIAKIDWESKGARAYSVPFTSDGYWARSRLPLFVASSGKPGKTIVAIGGIPLQPLTPLHQHEHSHS